MPIKIQQKLINHVKVEPVVKDGGEPDPRQIKGYDYSPTLYSNTFICAKKKSGKTNLIYKLLEEFVTKETEVFIFCSSVWKDQTYKLIMNMLNSKKVVHEVYTSFTDHPSKSGLTVLEHILQEQDEEDEEAQEAEQQKSQQRGPKFMTGMNDKKMLEEREKKSKKPKGPKYLFVFDDLGAELRHPAINQLLKTNRHRKCKVILSSQYLTDLQPQAIKQLDYVILFKSFNEEKLTRIYELLDLSIPLENFMALYKYATLEPFHFLFIDVRNDLFRKDFNVLINAATSSVEKDSSDSNDSDA